MFIGNPEMRERSRFLDSHLGEVAELLETEEVAGRLGNVATEFAFIADSLYIPNIKHGYARQPRKIPKRIPTPVIPLKPNELVVSTPDISGISPLQKGRILKTMKGWGRGKIPATEIAEDIEIINSEIKSSPMAITMPKNAHGVVTTRAETYAFDRDRFPHIGKSNFRRVRGQPIMGLSMGDKTISRNAQLLTIVHEMQHVSQGLLSPLRVAEKEKSTIQSYRDELEAYHFQTIFGLSLYSSQLPGYSGNPELLNGSRIEEMRINHSTSSDPFYPSKALIKALEEEGMDNIVITDPNETDPYI